MISLTDLAARIAALPPGRQLVALAGPPAAGKSTIAAKLAKAVNAAGRPTQVVPMDGFHLDNATLDAKGLRARKGAPETFDVDGLAALIQAVREGGDVDFPTFDRNADATVPHGGTLRAEIALFEGNYLLLDAPGWRDLQGFWDLTVQIYVPEAELRRRLMVRWTDLAPDVAAAKTEGNDLPNARTVLHQSVSSDYKLDGTTSV
ncbi:Pantothenate kinase [Jannaschia seosinensis]|uniref:Pantothenate kinase n=1 Tax=Jannaschia seosinensis TaxID=313367 RepID=A0A0M7B8S5_9RHOB|nr:hypothetical protein [Jannaschia seosinensis]CUH31765.1 Pantothenate kinase [Jannaschia seosinensis]